MSTYPRAVSLFTLLGLAVLSACSFLNVGYVCDADGRCVPGVIIRGVICPNGDIAPTEADCESSLQFSPQDLSGVDILTVATHGFTYITYSGVVEVEIEGGPTLNAQWVVINGRIVLSNPESVGNWVIANTPGSQTYAVEFRIEDAVIHAPGTSPSQVVEITTAVRYDGQVLDSDSHQYVYNPPPPPATPSFYAIMNGCPYGCGHTPYTMYWHSTYATYYQLQYRVGSQWYPFYSGILESEDYDVYGTYDEDLRVRAINSSGTSGWGYITLQVQCSEYHDPW